VVVLGGGSDIYHDDPGGDDVVCAVSGDDIIFTGDGTDRVYGGTGSTVMVDGPGTDHYDGQGRYSSLHFDGDRINVHVADGNESGNDDDTFTRLHEFSGTSGPDHFVGTNAHERFFGEGGRDVVRLGGGRDLTEVWSGKARIYGGPGADTVTVAGTGLVRTGGGDDSVTVTGSGKVVVFLGPGYDLFTADDGWADVDGGPQADGLIMVSSKRGALVDLANGTARFRGGPTFDVVDFEGIVGTRFDDVLRGSSRPDRIDGDSGDDLLIGRGGDDTLVGYDGRDVADGGAGGDGCDAEVERRCEL